MSVRANVRSIKRYFKPSKSVRAKNFRATVRIPVLLCLRKLQGVKDSVRIRLQIYFFKRSMRNLPFRACFACAK